MKRLLILPLLVNDATRGTPAKRPADRLNPPTVF